jgi:Phytanoyl-CoA dioxygenase (PhyH)
MGSDGLNGLGGVGGLTDDDVARFVRDGALRLERAFSPELAGQCRQLLWAATGCDEHDRSTWTRPVIRLEGRGDAPFVAAANTARLHSAFDELAGPGRWVPRTGLGTFPIRFPVDESPADDGWHIESTGAGAGGTPIVDPGSRERVLLLLFLFSDVGPNDAPTRVRVGSHLDAARLLFRTGRPVDFFEASHALAEQTADRPELAATGRAGDVWLCHPFVVHAAQRHRGATVRFMAQPPLAGTEPIDPARAARDRSPVEQAVRLALSA